MVAETVKSYPANYPALIPLSPSVAGLGSYNPCTSSLLHPGYSPTHMMDQKPPQQQQGGKRQESPVGGPHAMPDSPVGLGAPGLNFPSSLDLAAQLRKKEMFVQRKQREFIPDNKKDDSYWDRRRRNNEAAKRSREKRRFNDMILERRVVELTQENHLLKAQLSAIKDKYGIQGESLINADQVKASMPQAEQVLAANKRTKLSQAMMSLGSNPSVTSLLSPEGCDGDESPQSYHGQQDPQSPHYPLYPPSTPQMDDDQGYDTPFQQYGASNGDLNYGQSALNLSAHPSSPLSHSPPSPAISHMEYSPSDPELCRRSPEAGMSLPHKLRHKSHLGDKDAAQSLLALHTIKSEPNEHHQEVAEDSVGSSDERDSGISFSSSSSCSEYNNRVSDNSSSPTACVMVNSNSQHQQPQQQPLNMSHFHHQQSSHSPQHQPQQQHHTEGDGTSDYENTHLRSELERLATEVATLKYMLVRRPRSETDSDGSR